MAFLCVAMCEHVGEAQGCMIVGLYAHVCGYAHELRECVCTCECVGMHWSMWACTGECITWGSMLCESMCACALACERMCVSTHCVLECELCCVWVYASERMYENVCHEHVACEHTLRVRM